jgi:uncharacterized protein YmfQ (DUF2313 family)
MVTDNGLSFVYDEREVNLLDLLPQIYKPIYDFRALANSSTSELSKLYRKLSNIVNDQFIKSCSEETITKWERYLNLIPNGGDTLEERKFRVLTRLNDSPPYTDRYLEKRLNELCGKGYWRVHKDYDVYMLTIEVSLDSEANTETVINMVRDIIPANIELVVRNYRSRHSELANLTHEELASYTQDGIKYAEMFK